MERLVFVPERLSRATLLKLAGLWLGAAFLSGRAGAASDTPSPQPKPIPDGLTRCPDCGEFRGSYANPNAHILGNKPIATVRCLCDGIVCGNCGQERRHQPISSYWDEEDGHSWNVPHFTVWRECRYCGARNWVQWGQIPSI